MRFSSPSLWIVGLDSFVWDVGENDDSLVLDREFEWEFDVNEILKVNKEGLFEMMFNQQGLMVGFVSFKLFLNSLYSATKELCI